jgi:hypothetical protein
VAPEWEDAPYLWEEQCSPVVRVGKAFQGILERNREQKLEVGLEYIQDRLSSGLDKQLGPLQGKEEADPYLLTCLNCYTEEEETSIIVILNDKV